MPSFWRQVMTVLGGAVAAQALPLLAAPMLTRLCTPEQMGAFSVWLGMASIGAIAATLRLEAALILDHEREQQRVGLSVMLYSACVLALLLIVGGPVAHALGLPVFATLPWPAAAALGLASWMIACNQSMLAYATSHRAFGAAARAKIWNAASITLAQLGLLAAGTGLAGLAGGQLIGLTIGMTAAALLLRPPVPRLGWRLDPAQRAYLHRHRNFWRYSLPSGLLNASIGPLPLLLIGLRHGAMAAGLYALTQRVVTAPVSLVAASVLEVFKRQSVYEFERHGHCLAAYAHTFRSLVLLGAAPALILLVAAPDLFAFVFGERWRESGELARLLAPLCFLNFVAAPLSYVFFVAGKQRIELCWQLSLVCMTVSIFASPLSLHGNVLAYGIGYGLHYIVYMLMSWHFAHGRGQHTVAS